MQRSRNVATRELPLRSDIEDGRRGAILDLGKQSCASDMRQEFACVPAACAYWRSMPLFVITASAAGPVRNLKNSLTAVPCGVPELTPATITT